jgi:hypothetical protein
METVAKKSMLGLKSRGAVVMFHGNNGVCSSDVPIDLLTKGEFHYDLVGKDNR